MTATAPPARVPDRGEIHIWHSQLSAPVEICEWLWTLLSADERERAGRFHFPDHRDRFVVSRGGLRMLLGRYLDRDPAQLRFIYNQYGKPDLDDRASGLRFNVSHAGDRGLLALTQSDEIGVDIERIRADFATQPIAERFFSAREVRELCALPPRLRPDAFFRCWTRKEAFIKARGEGISLGLDRFSVSLRPDDEAALVGFDGCPDEVSRWRLYSVAAEPGYAAAFAVEGREHRVAHDGRLRYAP